MALTEEESGGMLSYAACRSLAGVGGGCSSFASFDGKYADFEGRCQKIEIKARMARVALRKGDTAAFCRGFSVGKGKKDDGPAAGRVCGIVIAAVRAGDAGGACPELEKQFGSPPGECRENMAAWEGKPQACVGLKDAVSKRECTDFIGLLAGLRRPELCAASPFCQVMEVRSIAACNSLRRAVSTAICVRAEKSREGRVRAERQREETEKARKISDMEARERELAKGKENEARRKADELAKQRAAVGKQFKKGQPTQTHSKEIQDLMDRLEKGLPPLPPKPVPEKTDDKR